MIGRIAMPFGGSQAGEPSNGKESLLTTSGYEPGGYEPRRYEPLLRT
ncbi:MAG TPA: hypothetical protein VHQ94_19825 [Pyrinomonadaceae bacterium]|nr:hypothetical protein [Pyrinomonadaceae bacterium]